MVRLFLIATLLAGCGTRDVEVKSTGPAEEAGSGGDGVGDEDDGAGSETLPDVSSCGGEAFLEWSASHFVWVIEQSNAARADTFDHDEDPETPDRTPLQVGGEFFELYADRFGKGEPCPAKHETALWFSPSLGADPFPSLKGCDLGDAYWEVGFHDEAAMDGAMDDVITVGQGGGNPLGLAHVAAVEHLLANSPDWGGRFVVLLVHTPPNCGQVGAFEVLDPTLLESVESAFVEHEIGTIVIGVDIRIGQSGIQIDGQPNGVDTDHYFNEVASLGGFPALSKPGEYYHPPTLDTLVLFDELWKASCLFPLSEPVPAGIEDDEIEITVNGTAYPRWEADCASIAEGAGGWQWLNHPDTLQLCGVACQPNDGICHEEDPHLRGHWEASWPCE